MSQALHCQQFPKGIQIWSTRSCKNVQYFEECVTLVMPNLHSSSFTRWPFSIYYSRRVFSENRCFSFKELGFQRNCFYSLSFELHSTYHVLCNSKLTFIQVRVFFDLECRDWHRVELWINILTLPHSSTVILDTVGWIFRISISSIPLCTTWFCPLRVGSLSYTRVAGWWYLLLTN